MGIAVVSTAVMAFIAGVLAGALLFYCISKHQSQNSKFETSSQRQRELTASSPHPLRQTGPEYAEVIKLKQNKAYEPHTELSWKWSNLISWYWIRANLYAICDWESQKRCSLNHVISWLNSVSWITLLLIIFASFLSFPIMLTKHTLIKYVYCKHCYMLIYHIPFHTCLCMYSDNKTSLRTCRCPTQSLCKLCYLFLHKSFSLHLDLC